MEILTALPSPLELRDLLAYVLGHPYLFVSSSTVMTTGLVVLATTLGAVDAVPRVIIRAPHRPHGQALVFLRWLAPKLALVLVYFGAGSMALATAILLRFGSTLPAETAMQFRSGLGHLALAALGLAALSPFLRAHRREDWLIANLWALGYWTFHVAFLTPPWFSFGGEGDLVLGVVKLALGVGFAVTLLLRERKRQAWNPWPLSALGAGAGMKHLPVDRRAVLAPILDLGSEAMETQNIAGLPLAPSAGNAHGLRAA